MQNPESDIRLEVPQTKVGCVIEVKYAGKGKYDQVCEEAMKQIDRNGYAEVLRQDGMETIHKYAAACCKKSCKIAYELEKGV